MIRRCRWCGQIFHPPPNKKGNNMQYCSNTCRSMGYKKHQKQARQQYQKRRANTKITIKNCKWCNTEFISSHSKVYCSKQCKKYALQEQYTRATYNYRSRHGRSEKDLYFSNLGNSNLRQKPDTDFQVESQLIKNELKRLHL